MLPALSPDQEFFRATTERFLADQVPPDSIRALRHDPAGFEQAYWRRGAELGWSSLLVREEHGGGTISGSGLADLGLVAYEFGRHAAPGPLLVTNIVASTLSANDTHLDILTALLSGEQIATWCAPIFGPDGWRPTVEACRHGGSILLRGKARLVESAARADHLLVTCREEAGVTQFLVPAGSPGVTCVAMETVDLTRRFGIVTFDDVSLPVDATVGTTGEAYSDVDRQFQLSLVILNAESVGAMQAGFDMTVEWSRDRYAFGRPLASYQALKHRFADMLTWLEASHAISDAACVATEQGAENAAELVSAAKAFVGQYGTEVLQDCVQMHGGIGVTFEHDLHLYLRRFSVDRALAGTPSDHRQRIAAMLSQREGEAA